MDTIFALATAQGKAGVAVVRLSGSDAHVVARQVAKHLPAGREPALRKLRDLDGELIDEALVLRFDAPHSFTGEDVIEFHLHGSTAVVVRMLQVLATSSARLAEPGEFTRRALENGKLDLAQVEGLADLIDAETDFQRRQAQQTLSGALGQRTRTWRVDLIRAASLIEAVIDFADEDVPTDVTPEVSELLKNVAVDIAEQSAGVGIAERIRTGFEVAIVGPPNAGKSTLLNMLAGREAAITSEYAGTTRDVIEVRMDLDGLPVTLLDTAGLRDTADFVESLGIEKARERASAADLRVFLVDDLTTVGMDIRDDDIVRRPKADLVQNSDGAISGKTGEGVDLLIKEIGETLRNRTMGVGLASRQRHKDALDRARDALRNAETLLEDGPDSYDLVAEHIRSAVRALEALIGRVDVENLLDEIFSSFCLGK
ncbi:tRNA uridine-5-carboxymethylaminomethyl(34) synthesis GTPase MnmE [Thalassococcus sp. S3]|uniref:tRNA uridine-5-carboxymethylaminomethyl(34) synthesis GTPase MnmE n=1 Tax=Thalassococcus sp. S3 TaxID=2017482 RepID=UPI0010245746|nr:tRNA uridine-5-carboxymethylaminomethyl(34) synthesis GTPase MnmE [Thalassococcus sp. S3]QBF34145.1 tRNA uridine-5-carboxymethylaminomethyl(34) synthesis GTPase MnmE [Thalassococcus sp. S3]